MQISSNPFYDIGTNYTIKLNERETLVVEDDPNSRALFEAKKAKKESAQEEEKRVQEKKESQNPQDLSEDEERLVKELASRDSEVRAHEAAHQAAGGGMVGAASYSYQQGPDGKMYAIGGEVPISMTSGATPEETIKNARQAAAAAMAPGDPSPQDFSVASSAKVMEMKAMQQITKETEEKNSAEQSYKESSLMMQDLDKEQEEKSLLDISA